MDLAALDYARARDWMVDGQVRPNKVYDRCIIEAMRRLPRERFLPPQLASRAYADEDVPLGRGRALIEPMVIARLVQAAAVVPQERALVVGAGTGYGAALLAACGAEVTALEEDTELQAIARAALAECAPGVVLVTGPLAAGWKAGAPWDIILIEGAVPAVPPDIAGQIRTGGGRLVTVLVTGGRTGRAVLAEMTPAGLTSRAIFDCATPLLPQLVPPPAFAF